MSLIANYKVGVCPLHLNLGNFQKETMWWGAKTYYFTEGKVSIWDDLAVDEKGEQGIRGRSQESFCCRHIYDSDRVRQWRWKTLILPE